MAHTVKGCERAGITMIQIEDPEFPKKCGHSPSKHCVPVEEMVEKIRVAGALADRENFSITTLAGALAPTAWTPQAPYAARSASSRGRFLPTAVLALHRPQRRAQ